MNSIIIEAGVAKITLYGHFETKELLITAALSKIDEQFLKTPRDLMLHIHY